MEIIEKSILEDDEKVMDVLVCPARHEGTAAYAADQTSVTYAEVAASASVSSSLKWILALTR